MKVRPVPVECTNPFAEAAGGGTAGDGVAGSVGATVGQTVSEWERAVQSVSGRMGGSRDPMTDDSSPDPTEQDVREAISGNLCRCTGYQGIVDAALDAAKRLGGSGP